MGFSPVCLDGLQSNMKSELIGGPHLCAHSACYPLCSNQAVRDIARSLCDPMPFLRTEVQCTTWCSPSKREAAAKWQSASERVASPAMELSAQFHCLSGMTGSRLVYDLNPKGLVPVLVDLAGNVIAA